MRGHPCVISDNFPPNPEADKLLRMAKRMAKARQRLATERQAEIDREAREASSAAVVGAVADLDGMVG